MNKEEILSNVTNLAKQNLLNRNELIAAFEKGKPSSQTQSGLRREVGISEVLYFIGGIIVFIGIYILIAQNWNSLNLVTRILLTLGFGIASYFVGIILNKEEKHGAVSFAFHLIAALVLPIGLGVFLDQMGYKYFGSGGISFITGVLFVMYLASFFVFKKPIFTFFTIVFGTLFFFSFTDYLIGSNPIFVNMKFFEYRLLFVGLSYLFLGFSIASTEQKDLTGVLYGFGTAFFLGAALMLGGWKPSQNIFWEIVFPGLVFGVLMLSVKLKSKAFLSVGTFYLMAYILKITAEYFSNTLGWPLSLVICGITLIGIGYYAFSLNKKYLSAST